MIPANLAIQNMKSIALRIITIMAVFATECLWRMPATSRFA